MKLKLFLAVMLSCIVSFALEIARGGKSDYVIVIRDKAPKVTVYCAEHLQKYMKLVAGVDMKIVQNIQEGKKAIFVGGHSQLPKRDIYDPAKYGEDEVFRITELPGGSISIMGADCDARPVSRSDAVFSLMWGTYTFIEKFLGVRWYAPGEMGECYFKKDTITVKGLPIEVAPRAYHRSVWPYNFLHFTSEESLEYCRHLRAFGIGDRCGNHSMMDLAFYAKDKDEIFALEPDGKSRNKGTLKYIRSDGVPQWDRYPQFCLTNPETFKTYCNFIDDVYEGRPAGKLWKTRAPNKYTITVVPNDNFTTQPCYCANCQAIIEKNAGRGAMSPLVWGFVKKVAEWAKKKYPDKMISTLAYEAYYLPPKFDLPDNVAVQICINPYIIYQGNPAFMQKSDEIISNWSRRVTQVQLWHYLMPYDSIPYAMPHIMYNWHARYPRVNASFLELNNSRTGLPYLPKATDNITRVFDLPQNHLNLFFAMKSLAGEKLDVDEELELYYRMFWGPVAGPMKRFCETSHNAWENINVSNRGDGAYPKFTGKELYEDIFTPEVVKTMNECYAEAVKLAPKGSIYAKRLEWIYMGYLKAFTENANAYAAELNRSRDKVLFNQDVPPVIDGKLDDEFWKTIEETVFQKIDTPLPANYRTGSKVGVTKDMIFFGIEASDPHAKNQRLTCTVHDSSVYGDDSIEIFFKPGGRDKKRFFNVTINTLGVVLDYVAGDRKLDTSYESDVQVKVDRRDDGFTMEIGIPLAKLEIPENGLFGMNVCRSKNSGVGEVHERSSWVCPYGSFWNFDNMPHVTLSAKIDPYSEDFSKVKKVVQGIRTMPNDKVGPVVKEGARYEYSNGAIKLYYMLDKESNRYDYGTYTVPVKRTPLNGARIIDICFKNPDDALRHTLTWSYYDAEGKLHGDWIRFCTSEKFEEWRVRSIDIMNGGHGAQTRKKKGLEPLPEPVEINSIQIYSSPARDGVERCIEVDYIRVRK